MMPDIGISGTLCLAKGNSAISFCVVIPMYNEERGAENCVREVCAILAQLPCRCALVVVNDGSRDSTGTILGRLTRHFPQLIFVDQARNGGYGAAIRAGVDAATKYEFDYVIFMDSDLTNRPSDIPRFIEKMEQGFDVIKASRYVLGGRMEGVPWNRALVSRAGNFIARHLFGVGVRDCTNGFRAVRTEILKRMDLHETGFPIIMEELYCCKFLAKRFCEVPVVLTNRSEGQRPTSFSYRPQTFAMYLKFGFMAFMNFRRR